MIFYIFINFFVKLNELHLDTGFQGSERAGRLPSFSQQKQDGKFINFRVGFFHTNKQIMISLKKKWTNDHFLANLFKIKHFYYMTGVREIFLVERSVPSSQRTQNHNGPGINNPVQKNLMGGNCILSFACCDITLLFRRVLTQL